MALCVRNLDQAALLLAHGYRLIKAPVGQWTYEFATLKDYLRWASGDHSVNVREVVTWNVACGPGEPLVRAHQIMYQTDRTVKALPQVQAARAFLINLLRERPKESLWIVVREGRMCFAMFGRNASLRTREESLNVL